MRGPDAGDDREADADADDGLWGPALANLLIGLLAILPALCMCRLLAPYPPAGCDGGFACAGEAPGHTTGVTIGAVLGGAAVLGLVLVVDVLMPRQEGRRMRTWLGMTVLVPIPFVVGQAFGWIQG
ncbi:hypothetical protein [Streptomyces avermitilis]|uniref:hypothetical protein n=1 Tax=Streptomyces avermitilis TaxID=33903 RepID=UPI0033A7B489